RPPALVLDGEHRLHPPVEVARHQVGAPQVDLLAAPVAEVEDAVVLQEAPDDADDADVLRESGYAGAEDTHLTHDQVDLHAFARRPVEAVDDLGVGEPVDLEDEVPRLAPGDGGGLAVDQLHQALPPAAGGEHDAAVALLAGVAGQPVEEVG